MARVNLPSFNRRIFPIFFPCTSSCIFTELQSPSKPCHPYSPFYFPANFISSNDFCDAPSNLQPHPFLPRGGGQDPETSPQLEHRNPNCGGKLLLKRSLLQVPKGPQGDLSSKNQVRCKLPLGQSPHFKGLLRETTLTFFVHCENKHLQSCWNVWKMSLVVFMENTWQVFAINASCKYCEWEPAGKNVLWDDREPGPISKEVSLHIPCTGVLAQLLTLLLQGNPAWVVGTEEGQPAKGASGLASHAEVWKEKPTHVS